MNTRTETVVVVFLLSLTTFATGVLGAGKTEYEYYLVDRADGGFDIYLAPRIQASQKDVALLIREVELAAGPGCLAMLSELGDNTKLSVARAKKGRLEIVLSAVENRLKAELKLVERDDTSRANGPAIDSAAVPYWTEHQGRLATIHLGWDFPTMDDGRRHILAMELESITCWVVDVGQSSAETVISYHDTDEVHPLVFAAINDLFGSRLRLIPKP
ncbi:MAG: hypothetical protein P4L74_06470 [Candidatus Doudnabacteria bacterium]|nr:hypothetical protein [Candidatus Doudnabacteria bacterium]